MNLNLLAVEICKREGKKKQVDIAQVKEILKVLIEILSEGVELDDPFTDLIKEGSMFEFFRNKIFEKAEKNTLIVTKINRKTKAVTLEPYSKSQQRRLKVQKKAKKK